MTCWQRKRKRLRPTLKLSTHPNGVLFLIRALLGDFIKMIKRETTNEEELEKLEDAIAFRNVSNMPARVKCALLAWYTLEDMLNQKP